MNARADIVAWNHIPAERKFVKFALGQIIAGHWLVHPVQNVVMIATQKILVLVMAPSVVQTMVTVLVVLIH